MKLDFTNLPVVDAHAHPFMPSREKKPYGRRYILSSDRFMTVPDDHIRSTLAYRMILIELARLFDLPKDAPDDEIIAYRNDLAQKDYKGFVELLLKDAGITTYLNETGFPIQGARLRPEEVSAFESASASLKVKEIIRLEKTCNHLIEDTSEKLGFEDFLSVFTTHMQNRIEAGGVVALKTVIGYFSGLEIQETARADAERSFYSHFYSRDMKRTVQKPFRDFMVFELVKLCQKYNLPFQIHTGAGDPPSCDLRLMNPVSLYEFLNRKDTGTIQIVLLHGGYPFAEELAFMVNGYANVHTDVSSITADDSIAIERVLPIILEKVPLTKLMYGSDGAGDIDPIWFAAVNFKRVLARVFKTLVDRNVLTESYARKAAAWILSENAEKFYNLA